MGNSNDQNTIAGNNIQHSNVNIGDGARQVIQPTPQSEQEVSYPAFSPKPTLSRRFYRSSPRSSAKWRARATCVEHPRRQVDELRSPFSLPAQVFYWPR